jgi:hypothetical protein
MLRENTILVKRGDFTNTYTFNSKNDLKQSSMQNVLMSVHKQNNAVRCSCDMSKELYLSVKKIGKKYFLAKYPKSQEHHPQCIFHSLINELLQIEDDEIGYKSSILEEPEPNSEKSNSSEFPKESAKRNTFYMFCHDLISQANKVAFLMANKQSKNLYNYNKDDFFRAFLKAAKSIKIVGSGNVLEYCKKNKGTTFEYGIVPYDIVGNLDVLSIKDNNELIEIDVERIYFDVDAKEFMSVPKKARITFKRLKLTRNLVMNLGNVTAAPYFYIAVYNKGVMTRFYISPIYEDEENICFVDSGYERAYAQSLYANETVFIKPIGNDEVDILFPFKLGLPTYVDKIPHILYKSDFLLFTNGRINIVEVSGYDKEEYQNLLKKKERYYQNLHEVYLFFEYTVVDGKTQTTIRRHKEEEWNGELLVEKGKYEGVQWSEVPKATLYWYIENLGKLSDFSISAKRELYRRENESFRNRD